MGFFQVAVEWVDLGGENSIAIRPLTFGEEQSIRSAALRMSAGTSGEGSATVDLPLMETMTLQYAITDWKGDGFEGKPVSVETIGALPNWVAKKVLAAVRAREAQEDKAKNV
jgi:hypothetical protein